jgi:hypothetical protein
LVLSSVRALSLRLKNRSYQSEIGAASRKRALTCSYNALIVFSTRAIQ